MSQIKKVYGKFNIIYFDLTEICRILDVCFLHFISSFGHNTFWANLKGRIFV